jgi:hypothetical protein
MEDGRSDVVMDIYGFSVSAVRLHGPVTAAPLLSLMILSITSKSKRALIFDFFHPLRPGILPCLDTAHFCPLRRALSNNLRR